MYVRVFPRFEMQMKLRSRMFSFIQVHVICNTAMEVERALKLRRPRRTYIYL